MLRLLRIGWAVSGSVASRPKRLVLAVRWASLRALDLAIDRYHRRQGIVTAGPLIDVLPSETTEARGYVPTEWWLLPVLFRRRSLGAGDVLLEYGSGKGRVAIWAARRFREVKVIAVERDAELVAQARKNSVAAGVEAIVTVVHEDATAFIVPDDVTAVYLYNPFIGDTFRATLARLQESMRRVPRSVRVIYRNPVMHQTLIEGGFTVERASSRPLFSWAIYAPPPPG